MGIYGYIYYAFLPIFFFFFFTSLINWAINNDPRKHVQPSVCFHRREGYN